LISDDPMRDHDDAPPEFDGPSRSQERRDALAVLDLAKRLVELSDAQLAQVPLDEDLRAEVLAARRITQQIARKRQTQFLAKQLRKREDALAPIRAALEQDRALAHRENAALHHVEQWRERLLDGGDEALAQLLEEFPQADRQQLRQLVRNALAERKAERPPHAYRQLFRLLREAMHLPDDA
jgi:ribosome-associated protein